MSSRPVADLVRKKSTAVSYGSGTGDFVDLYRRRREPSARDLLAELKNTAWTCASVNAAVCASYYPRLFVSTSKAQPGPKCQTATVAKSLDAHLRDFRKLPAAGAKAMQLAEVLHHPLLDLFRSVNPIHNAYDLWELTTLYQEVHGSAYWYLEDDALGRPEQLWPLPPASVRPVRANDSGRVVDYYEVRTGSQARRLDPDSVIHFAYPDPRDPYCGGLSPLRAVYEQVLFTSQWMARKTAVMDNDAIPAALISPAEVIGEEEADRLEAKINAKFRRAGAGKIHVAESAMKADILQHSMGDLAALAEYGATKEDVANGFHVPMAYLTRDTNMANIQAAKHQHRELAIGPRLRRRDEKLNEKLIPRYDPSGRLFLASEDPVPINSELEQKQQEIDLKYGLRSINQIRAERGEDPVPWGDVPWLPGHWWRTDTPRGPGILNDGVSDQQ